VAVFGDTMVDYGLQGSTCTRYLPCCLVPRGGRLSLFACHFVAQPARAIELKEFIFQSFELWKEWNLRREWLHWNFIGHEIGGGNKREFWGYGNGVVVHITARDTLAHFRVWMWCLKKNRCYAFWLVRVCVWKKKKMKGREMLDVFE